MKTFARPAAAPDRSRPLSQALPPRRWLRLAGGCAALALAVQPVARAGSFSAGDLVVQQVEGGAAAPTQNNAFSMVELNPASPGSNPVQTIAITPSTITVNGTSGLFMRMNGSGGTSGYLANSNDGTLLTFASQLSSNTTSTYNQASTLLRGVGTLNASGTFAVPTFYTGTSGNQCRGATTVDNSTWIIADKGGIYTNNGTTTTGTTVNILATKSFGGKVYAFSGTAPGVNNVVASGTSPAIGTLSALSGLSVASYTDFWLISSGVNGATYDICYVSLGTNSTTGTINKYSLVNGTWHANGTFATGVGGRSILAAGNGSGATLFLTSAEGATAANKVYKLADNAGYNATISVGTVTASNIIYTAGTFQLVKGIAFAPLASALPDLTIAAAAPANAAVGVNFNYTLTVANSGAAAASGVTAQFTLPAGLTFVSASENGSAGFSPPGSAPSGVVTFTGGSLAAGASDTLTVTVTAASAATYTAVAGAAVVDPSNAVAESNENNNTSNVAASTVVADLPDLTVDVTGGPGTASAGVNFSYTLTAHNVGTASASGVAVQFTLPAGLTFVAAADGGSAGFTGANSSGVVTFSGGTLAAGASESLTVTVSAPTTGTVAVAAGAAVINPGDTVSESNTGNDASTSTVSTVITAPDLVVTSTPSGAYAATGSSGSYAIFVSNGGSAATTGSTVTVTDTLPAGLTPLGSMNGTTVSGWSITVSGQTVTATRSDTLATGTGYPALTISFTVDGGASGSLTNTVSVSGGGDVSSGNDSAGGTVTIGTATPISSAGKLLVSRGHYTGNAATVVVGSTLPNGSTAVADGTYPGVWGNESPDASFGVTAPIYLDVMDPSTGSVLNSYNVTAAASTQLGLNLSTSFPSKSEIALNPTPDGTGVTFMCYLAPANTVDVSNSDTPYHIDPSNPITLTGSTGIQPYQRAVVEVDYLGNVRVTPVNPYSGNNGRAAVLANSTDGNAYYFMVGNAGNGSPTGAIASLLSDDTGVQMVAPGAGGNTTVVGETWGTYGSTTGYEHGFSLAALGQTPDKTGKDMNLRGLTYNPYTNTLYASKGSGGNGINTVYQVGTAGSIPTPSNAGTLPFTIPSGLPQTNGQFPFGLWFANATTLYVADEGQANATTYDSTNHVYTPSLPANNPTAGLQKWIFNGTSWSLAYTLQSGLNLGVPYTYTIANYPTGNNSATGMPWQPGNNGLRNITGRVNGDGTVTIFAVTSTTSGETDQGADPNQLVSITDTLAASSLPGAESFSVVAAASGLDAFRGVSLSTPVTPNLAVAFGSAADVPVSSNGFTASGLSLDPIELGFAPTSGQVLTLVNNTGSGAVVGTFSGLAEGSTVTASYGGHTYSFTLSYVGGDGNDITLATQAPVVPSGVQTQGTTGFRRPAPLRQP